MASNELNVIYNHPYVASNITNNDTIFQSTSGNRPFFSVIVSERGEDNKIKLTSSVEEFLFNYGEPNLKKFGQAAFNIINILQNGESVYTLRVLPDNAGYSHAMLNIQTKIEGTKYVKNVDGERVQIDNIVIRPTVTYSQANNTSETLLEYDMTNATNSSVDGYRNNMLFYVIPVGRGEYYDKYGFRIYLNTSYDDTYDFRVYNFEVIEFDEYDNASIIEGPFYVALDPDALTTSNESMFIEDVVNRYSKYLRVKFNDIAYDYVTKLINPDVNPSHLDILSGKTREVNGEVETYFCDDTQKMEDIHIKILKYDDNGNLLTDGVNPITTFVESSDAIEKSIINIDNSVRNSAYTQNRISLENMKKAISDIYTDIYVNSINVVGTLNADQTSFTESSKVVEKKKDVEDKWTSFKDAKTAFESAMTESSFIEAFNKSIILDSALTDLVGDYRFLNDYARVIVNDSSTLNILNNIDTIESTMNTKEVVSVKLTAYKKSLNDYISGVIENKTVQNVSEEAYNLKIMLVELSNIIDYYKAMADNEASVTSALVDIVKVYNDSVDLISQIESEYIPDTSKEEFLSELYNNIDDLLVKLISLSNSLILINMYNNDLRLYDNGEGNSDIALTIIDAIAVAIAKSIKKYTDSKDNAILKEELLVTAKQITSVQSDVTVASKNNIYTTILTNFNQPIQFKYGSEGDLSESDQILKNKTKTNLLIKGYKGLIDDGITSKKIIPARFIIDGNENAEVKNAMHVLVTEIRDDIFFYCDTGFTSSPEDALSKRQTDCNFSSIKIAIYTQDFTIYDEYSGRDIKVTTPYFLSSKIPYCSTNYGLHMPIAGNKRGIIDGFKSISWIPNEAYKELLYNKKINYIESDSTKTKFGSQLTSESRNTPLSNINNVITVIDIKNDVELMAENYQFEFNNQDTIDAFQSELTDYLSKYTSSMAAERIVATVYASDYDKLMKILRVAITIKFYDIIERILLNLDVVKK